MLWGIEINNLIECGGWHFWLGSSVALAVSVLILTISYQRLLRVRYLGLFYIALLLLSFLLGALSHLWEDYFFHWF